MITGTDAMLKVRAGKWGVQSIARARGGKRGPSRRAGLCASEWHDGAYRKIGGEPRDMTVIAVSDANQHCDATSLRCVTAKVLFSKANDDVTQMAQVFRRILRRRSQASGTGARALGRRHANLAQLGKEWREIRRRRLRGIKEDESCARLELPLMGCQ